MVWNLVKYNLKKTTIHMCTVTFRNITISLKGQHVSLLCEFSENENEGPLVLKGSTSLVKCPFILMSLDWMIMKNFRKGTLQQIYRFKLYNNI